MTIRTALCPVLAATGLAFSIATGAIVPASAAPPPANGCAAVEMVVVRGSAETFPADHLHIGIGEVPVVDAVVKDAAATVSSFGIDYLDTLYDPAHPADYEKSMQDGREKLAAELTKSSKQCPSQKFALMGYSQGAQVVGDALAGYYGGTPEVSSALGSKVVAVVLYGDPDFVAGEPFNSGNPSPGVSGVNARPKGALKTYADRIVSYCNSDDNICQSGLPNTTTGHWDYFKYGEKAASFIEGLLPQPIQAIVQIKGLAGKCVDVNGASSDNGTAVQLYGCNGSAAQNWTVGGDSTIKALGKCMAITNGDTADETPVELWDCDGSNGQKWNLNSDQELVNPSSSKCLDVKYADPSDRTRLILWPCHGRDNQKWALAS